MADALTPPSGPTSNTAPVTPGANTPNSGGGATKPASFGQLSEMDDVALGKLATDAEASQAKKKRLVTDAPIQEGDDGEAEDFDDDDDDEEGEDEEGTVSEEDLDEEAEETEGEDEDDDEDVEEEDSDETTDDEGQKKHRVKVDGQVQEFTLDQLKTIAASGLHSKKKVDALISQVKTKEGEVVKREGQLKAAAERINPVYKALKEKNIDQAYLTLAEQAGLSKLDVVRQLREKFMPVIAHRLGLNQEWVQQRLNNPEVREFVRKLDLEEENQFLKSEREKGSASRKPSEADVQAQRSNEMFQALKDELGISKAELAKVSDFLFKDVPPGERKPVPLSQLKRTVETMRTVDKAIEAISAVRPSLVQDEKFLDRVIDRLTNKPDWSIARCARWVEKQARTRAEKQKTDAIAGPTRDLSRKLLKNRSKSDFQNPKGKQKKPMRFSDLGGDLV